MTEAEAKTKMCHRTLVRLTVPSGGIMRGALCIASACMAWRWSDVPPPAGPAWKPTEGFCGLAGRP